MEKNKYIEALDTLIRFYNGKIAELEAMKLDVIVENTTTTNASENKPYPVKTMIHNDPLTNQSVMRTEYSDGHVVETIV